MSATLEGRLLKERAAFYGNGKGKGEKKPWPSRQETQKAPVTVVIKRRKVTLSKR